MNYADLLKHVMNSHNFTRYELAYTFKIKPQFIVPVLNGEKELTKKQLSLLSQFTGISSSSILAGDFVLENISLERNNTEHTIKEKNYSKLKNFTKKVYSDYLSLTFFCFTFIIYLIFVTWAIVESVFFRIYEPAKPIDLAIIFSIIPAMLAFMAAQRTRKVALNFSFKEIDSLKIYYKLFFIALLICDFLSIFIGCNTLLSFLVSLIVMAYIAYDFFSSRIVTTAKAYNNRTIGFIVFFTILFISFVLSIDFSQESIDATNLVYGMIRMCMFISLADCFQSFTVLHQSNLWKNCFGELPEKKVLKKHHLLKSLIIVAIVSAIAFLSLYIFILGLYIYKYYIL